MEFRIATIKDAPGVQEIYNEHILAGRSTMDRATKSIEEIQGWFTNFNDRELVVLLEEGEYLIGWGVIKRYSDRIGYARACETAVYLRSAELRKGYGTMIKKWIIDKCRELEYHHLVAKIFSINQASIDYNLKLGYELVGTQREIGFVDGKWQDVTILQFILD